MKGFKLYDVSLVVKTDLDDVIERLKYDREIDMDINELAPQIAKWLEELKAIREYIKPLRNTNTHNEYLERLKELVK